MIAAVRHHLLLIGIAVLLTGCTQISSKAGYISYKNEQLGIKFSYPELWGEVREEQLFEDVQMRIILRFSELPSLQFITQTKDYSYPVGLQNEAIYSILEYGPQNPAEFCKEQKGCGLAIKPTSPCQQHVVHHCQLEPPQNIIVKKINDAPDIKKANSKPTSSNLLFTKNYFLNLHGDVFRTLTVKAELENINRSTYCETYGYPMYNCMNAEDADLIEKTFTDLYQSELMKQFDVLIASIDILKPKDQTDWYMQKIRAQLNIKPVSISSANKVQVPIEDKIEVGTGSVIVLTKQSPVFETSKIIELSGRAGINVKDIHVRYICENTLQLGTGSIIRPFDGQMKEWEWTYTIESSWLCRGNNRLIFVPDTCALHSKPWCQYSTFFSLKSDIAAFHPSNVIITSPSSDKTNQDSQPQFSGIAGNDVEQIEVKFMGSCMKDAKPVSILKKPDDANGEWEWNYKHISSQICAGSNTFVFHPSTCTPQSYGYTCGLGKVVSFFSEVGDIEPNALTMFRRGLLSDTSDLNNKEKIIVNGIAGSNITSISMEHECDDLFHKIKDVIIRPANENGKWTWSYELSVDKKTLCRGINKIHFSPVSKSIKPKSEYLEFMSNVGFLPPERALQIERIQQYASGLYQIVPDTIKPISISNEDPIYTKFCGDDFGMRVGNSEDILEQASFYLSKQQRLGDTFLIRLRKAKPNELRETVAGVYASNTSAALEFSLQDENSMTAVPSPLFGFGCNAGAQVYYLASNRIIVHLSQGFETSSAIFLWDGEKWKELSSLVPVNNPIELGAVNEENFIIEETRGCCDMFVPTIPGDWSDFVIDWKSFRIVDVIGKGPYAH